MIHRRLSEPVLEKAKKNVKDLDSRNRGPGRKKIYLERKLLKVTMYNKHVKLPYTDYNNVRILHVTSSPINS